MIDSLLSGEPSSYEHQLSSIKIKKVSGNAEKFLCALISLLNERI
jgi:hypothetical protein